LWYPLFLSGAVAAFFVMLSADLSPAWAAYASIMAVAFAVVVLEQWFPERKEWRPEWSDVKADTAFMGIVQVALPRALVALGVVELSGWIFENAPSRLWPHDWPLAAQIVTMVLAVDFLRYWLHRACHYFAPLWRLHEVHHSPDILYALNVGRFHPFEKTLHFCLDTVPFVLLGVSPDVIAGYFLLYSVNGFFQHSNLRLRYGWLNYLVASAETHRWHHARDPKAASCNFGNTTVVWDLLFGTWYLSKDKPIGEIGIMDRTYPKGFWAQMFRPFRRRDDAPWRTPRAWLADALVTLNLWSMRLIQGRRIAADVKDPMRVQNGLLARIITENRDTGFGRQHGFGEIKSYAEFARRVPVGEYEAVRPFVDAEIERGEKALTGEPPEWYVRTSGTTGKPKDIPLTRSHLKALRRIHQTSVAFQHRVCPEAFSGGIMAIVSPAYEGVLANGKPYGSASGIVASNTPAPVLEKFVIPAPVLTVSDSRVKYLLILRLALARPDVTYFGAANSTTMLALIKLYREHQSALIEDLRRGTFFLAERVPQEVRSAIGARLHPCPEQAARLARLQAGPAPRISDLWPALRLVVTWTCASAGVAVQSLRAELSPRTRILELGYVSSEFRGTITVGRRAGSGLPTFDAHFFEFVEREKWDSGEPEFLTLDRVRKGVDYYLIVTTPSGLYRYFINDLVRVTGFLYRTPLLKFLQKGKGVTNITGEKLYEAQVLAAVSAAMADAGRAARFVMMLADEEERRYRLYVEAEPGPKPEAAQLGEAVDAKLRGLNVEYMAKRESERLGAPSSVWLASETGEAYKQFCVRQGQREGQFKTVALAYVKGFGFDLDACAERH